MVLRICLTMASLQLLSTAWAGNLSFFIGTISNVLANLVFWFLLGLAFWLTGLIMARRFSQFFGLNDVRSITVYLSNLYRPETSISGSPDGRIISLHELRAAQSVNKILGSAPLRLPDVVRGLVDSLWLHGQIQSDLSVSPLNSTGADFNTNLVVIGSSVRNSIRANYVSSGFPAATFLGEDTRSEVHGPIEAAVTVVISEGGAQRTVR